MTATLLRRESARPAVIGMVHLLTMEDQGTIGLAVERAVSDAAVMIDAGIDAMIVENFGDSPFYPGSVPSHTIAGICRAVLAVRERAGSLGRPIPVGVNVLRNDALGALGIAAATGAEMVRVNVHAGAMLTDQGIIQGRAHESVRYRDRTCPPCAIWADVRVKHAAVLAPRAVEDEVSDLAFRGRADAVIVSGDRTGGRPDLALLQITRAALGHHPLLLGSGVTPDLIHELSVPVQGLIVGSYLKTAGDVSQKVDAKRVALLLDAVAERWG